jgi:hypothetical protein
MPIISSMAAARDTIDWAFREKSTRRLLFSVASLALWAGSAFADAALRSGHDVTDRGREQVGRVTGVKTALTGHRGGHQHPP